jgi:hypothetical protein
MLGLIAHHTGNLLDVESSIPHLTRLNRTRSNDSASSSSCDIPKMIMCDDCDSMNDSISSRGRSQSPIASPRSIFHSYWTSSKKVLNGKNDYLDDNYCADDVLERLRTLKMPPSDVDGNDACGDSSATVVHPARPTSTPRRQILPPPPAPSSVVTPLWMLLPPDEDRHYYDEYDQPPPHHRRNSLTKRPWSSATSLLGGGRGGGRRGVPPSQSCLRKSRYSFSAGDDNGDLSVAAALAASAAPARLHPGLRNMGHADLRASSTSTTSDMSRSVSFYSEVSVVEYAVPMEQQRSQEGWSRYFA